jgi:hypothetical protein
LARFYFMFGKLGRLEGHKGVEGIYATIVASALMLSTRLILTLTCSPGLALATKTENPLTLPKPSPLGLKSSMSTSYVPPTSTGQSKDLPRLFFAFLGARFLGLMRHLPRLLFNGY